MDLLPIQDHIWKSKYQFTSDGGISGAPSDQSIEDTWWRVAWALAKAEGPDERIWAKRFYAAMEGFKFIPAGRVVAGAGTGRSVTLFNCFVLNSVPDSMEGIFQTLKEGALTLQQGGGIGTDFSTLRPKGALVKGVGADASGPVSFMDCWNSMCHTIMSAGARRGAMMGTLRCDHPDIEAFIEAKRDPAKLRMFNISVLVTDAFMDAVKNGSNWDLQFGGKIYKTVSARGLWEQIMRSAYDYAEPGVIFIDRINKTNNLRYCETISATNPCAEQPLPPNGACLLGSINLAAFVRNPFKPDCFMDKAVLEETVHVAVRMLDNVIDVSNYPLESQEREAKSKRRLGLGVTGLADALVMCGLHYGSKIARNTAAFWQRMITEAAYQESIRLADEKGAFPLYDAERAPIPDCLTTNGVAEGFETCRRRNSHLISIAPTGTISLLAGNVSSGVEPIYEWNFKRKILEPDGTHRFEEVEDYAIRLWRSNPERRPLPDEFRARHHELTPKEHLLMQAVLQPHVDSSISKTVNCPENMPFKEFENLYLDAYKLGLKCCAAFRPNAVTGSVLSAVDDEPKVVSEFNPSYVSVNKDGSFSLAGSATFKDDDTDFIEGIKGGIKESFKKLQDALHPGTPENPPLETMPVDIKVNIATNTDSAPDGEPLNMAGELTSGDFFVIKPTATNTGESYSAAPPPREAALDGKTYKLRWPPSPHAIYITINDDEDGNAYEIFINSKNLEHYAWTVALTRMVSAIFRRGGDIGFVPEELKAVFDPKGGAWMEGKYVPSLLAAIGNVIERHIDTGAHAPRATDEGATNPEALKAWMERNPMPPTPEEYASKFDIGSGITATSKHAGVVPGNWPATCPKCFSSNVRFPKPGCTQCLDCGYSNCE